MLDHDANVSPWRIACESSGADHVLAPFDPTTGLLDPASVIALIDERTRWVTLPGASNLLGTTVHLEPIIAAAHAVGARVYVDAVALAPHRSIDLRALGCDALVSSPYKWYGPHAGLLYVDPEVRATIPIVKIAASSGVGPGEFETGMPNFEAIAGIEAAARFLSEEGMDRIEAAETAVYRPLLEGLRSIDGVTVFGPDDLSHRCPTVAFRVRDLEPAAIARALAAERIAVWDGHNYALNVVATLGVAERGGVVRAGISRYCDADDVERLLRSVERLASGA
jgi:selenocysteine lyase/cysteine desulfurase